LALLRSFLCFTFYLLEMGAALVRMELGTKLPKQSVISILRH
jgi:hypothetical protein